MWQCPSERSQRRCWSVPRLYQYEAASQPVNLSYCQCVLGSGNGSARSMSVGGVRLG
jgi:hypothetical protein